MGADIGSDALFKHAIWRTVMKAHLLVKTMNSDTSNAQDRAVPHNSRRQELFVFLVLAVLIWPVVAVGVVGGYGFSVWMYQIVSGLPGPPRH